MRFEVLFEIGAHAIHDNYFREAISSFASALERFLEFYIRVICRKNGIDPAVLDNAWKPVSKQSERQLGAYFFLYLTNEGSTAPYLLQNMIELRNAVVHKGKIASQEDAISFGNAVLSVINPVLQMLRDTYPEIVQAIVSDHLAEAMKHTNGKQVSTTCIRTIVSVLQDAENVTDLGNWAPPQYFS
jgi:hypothetical protein